MHEKKNKLFFWPRRGTNGGYMFTGGGFRLQLNGDNRLGGFFLFQAANALGKTNFQNDLAEILDHMIANGNMPAFTLYESGSKAKAEQEKASS